MVKTRYLLPCPCGREIAVEVTRAGEYVECTCGAQVEVPTLQRLKRLKPAITTPAPAVTPPRWGVPQRLLLAGILLTVVGLLLTAWIYSERPVNRNTSEITPSQAWYLWNELNKGPQYTPPPIDAYYLAGRAAYYRWMAVFVVVTTSGAAMIVGSLLAKAKQRTKAKQRKE